VWGGAATVWSYENSSSWHSDGYPACGGASQSPIDIQTANAILGSPEQPLKFDYAPYDAGRLHLVNEGHFFGVNGRFGVLTLPDGRYNALQVRIHFPSEHRISGQVFGGELQIFHSKEGTRAREGLVAIAIPLLASGQGASSAATQSELAFFQSLGFGNGSLLPALKRQTATVGQVDLGQFARSVGSSYHHYMGSLTSPPCIEPVHWFVMTDAAAFPSGALDAVHSALIRKHSRPPQPLYHRKVIKNSLVLPGEFPSATGILFDCGATREWFWPQMKWCCDRGHVTCPPEGAGVPLATRRGSTGVRGSASPWRLQYDDFAACKGELQSPINIVPSTAVRGPKAQPLSYFYAPVSHTAVINDGQSLQVAGQFGYLTLPDGIYDATHIRFCFPSEHVVDGRSAAGELQIYHNRRGCTVNCTAAVSILLELPGQNKTLAAAVSKFFKDMGFDATDLPAKDEGSVLKGTANLHMFRGQLSGGYYHYLGSQTEPPCVRSMHWFVIEQPGVVPSDVVAAFGDRVGHVHGRQPAPLGGRQVLNSSQDLPGVVETTASPVSTTALASTTALPETTTPKGPIDCNTYQADAARRAWCVEHEKMHHFRRPVYEWSYADPEAWVSLSPKCNGSEQSPIDLGPPDPVGLQEMQDLRYDYYAYEASGERRVVNDGRVLCMDGDFGTLVLPGGLYQVKQFLFHFPSEHTIVGKHAVGELQILHQKQGSHGFEDIAVISLLLMPEDTLGRPCEGKEREFFRSLGFGTNGSLPAEGEERGSSSRVDLGVFERQLKGHYFHYIGSLTVPPCTEGIHWYVLHQPAPVSFDIIASVRGLFPNGQHSRPTQPSGSRKVVTSRVGLPGEFGGRAATYSAADRGDATAQPEASTTTTPRGSVIDCPFNCRSSELPDAEEIEWCCLHQGRLCEYRFG